MIDREQVLHIAKLSRLKLSEEEVAHFTTQLGSILEYVEQLENAPTEGADVVDTIADIRDALRDDTPVPSCDRETILQNGPRIKDHHFAVPKVIS